MSERLTRIIEDYRRGICVRDLARWYGVTVDELRLSLTPNVQRQPKKPKRYIKAVPCPDCAIRPFARGLCRQCYKTVWSRGELDKFPLTRWHQEDDADGT